MPMNNIIELYQYQQYMKKHRGTPGPFGFLFDIWRFFDRIF